MLLQTMLFPGVLEVVNGDCIVAFLRSATATTIADEKSRGHYSHTMVQRLERT